MLKKIVVGVLVLTVIGGSVFALLDRPNVASSGTLSSTPTMQPVAVAGTASSTQPAQSSTSNVGEEWSGSGTILNLTDVGMTLALQDGSEVYVELGSPTYWQAQGVTLNVGAVVTVDGFFNGTDYHARTVTTSKGEILSLRTEAGQPLWSGGSGSGSGATGGQGEAQVPADQWITLNGTVTALTNNGVVVQTTDGQSLTVSFGRADFWQTQAVTFAVGDAISMLGFWQGTQFNAGQVTKTASGERIMLRDPNGRPLWAGPGRSQTGGTGTATGKGNGNGGQGKGKNNQGQQATPQPTATANP